MPSLWRLAHDVGTFNAMLYAISRLLSIVTFGHSRLLKYDITAQPVRAGEMTPPRRGRQITVVEADREQIMAMEVDRPPDVLEQRIRNGGRCLAAYKDGSLAGFQWFTLNDYPEDEVRCFFRLAPHDRCAWDFDIYVVPEWRTQPVFSRLWDKCNSILREARVEYSLSRINAYNGPSRRAHERLGAQIVGWAMFLCVGSAQLAVFSDRPWVHASLRQSRAPVLAVSRMARKAVAQNSEIPA